jgi:hypothetical protein
MKANTKMEKGKVWALYIIAITHWRIKVNLKEDYQTVKESLWIQQERSFRQNGLMESTKEF